MKSVKQINMLKRLSPFIGKEETNVDVIVD